MVALTLPPTRNREEDIELLAETFVCRLATSNGLSRAAAVPRGPRSASGSHLAGERAGIEECHRASAGILTRWYPAGGGAGPEPERAAEQSGRGGLPFPAELATIIRASVVLMLKRCAGNKSEAARRLGISRPRLQRLLEGKSDTED